MRASDICVLAYLDLAFGALNEKAPIAPGGQAIRREPVDPNITVALVRTQHHLAEILKARLVGHCRVLDKGVGDLCIFRASEVEELVRKLWLSALVVLLNDGSPIQVATAVLVSGWAHVLHATFKPWKDTDRGATYRLQHFSLFVTSTVFLVGLLFKVQGVGHDNTVFSVLAWFMVALCGLFIGAWVVVAGGALATKTLRLFPLRMFKKASVTRLPPFLFPV